MSNKCYLVESNWLPDLIHILNRTFKQGEILIIKKGNKYTNSFKNGDYLIRESYLFNNIKRNFYWIIIENHIYDINHFCRNMNLINDYVFSFFNFQSITFDPRMEINIFSIYILVYCLKFHITIKPFLKLDKSTIIITDRKLNTECSDNLVIISNHELDCGINIIHNNYNINKIIRNKYIVYNDIPCSFDIYTGPSTFHTISANNFNHLNLYDRLIYKFSKFNIEISKNLPSYIIFQLVNAINILTNQMKFIKFNYNQKNNKLYFLNKPVVHIIWYKNGEDILSKPKMLKDEKKIIKDSLFKFFFYCNKITNTFKIRLFSCNVFSHYGPFIDKLRDIYFNMTNKTYFSLKSINYHPIVDNNVNIKQIVYLLLGLVIFTLKNIITISKNNTNVKVDLKLKTTPLKLIQDFINQYYKYNRHYPLLLLWDPKPSIIINKIDKNIISTQVFIIISQIMKYLKLDKMLYKSIINIRLQRKTSNLYWIKDKKNIDGNKFLKIYYDDTFTHIKGLANFNTRIVFEYLKEQEKSDR